MIFEKGEIIVQEQSPSTEIYIIMEGKWKWWSSSGEKAGELPYCKGPNFWRDCPGGPGIALPLRFGAFRKPAVYS